MITAILTLSVIFYVVIMGMTLVFNIFAFIWALFMKIFRRRKY